MKIQIKKLVLPINLSLVKEALLILSLPFLISLGAKLKVEIGPVPITFQTFFVLLGGAFLKKKKAVLSLFLYLIFGLLGMPLFARGGGLSYIFSPTFGYILGFILAGFLVGFLLERNWDRTFKKLIFAFSLADLSIYLPGLVWLGKFVGFKKVLAVGFYPFIFGDLLKIILASLVYKGFKKIL